MSDFRARLSANAEEFDTIISEVLAENDALKAELIARDRVGAFRHKETGEVRYGLTNEHKENDWEDVVILLQESAMQQDNHDG